MASSPIASWQIDEAEMETVTDFILGGSKITVDGACSHKIKRCLLLGRRAMTNLECFEKQRHHFDDKDMYSQSESCSVVSNSLRPHGLYSPWNSLGQNTEVGNLSLLWWIFPTQESNWGLLHCRWILYHLSYQGIPKTSRVNKNDYKCDNIENRAHFPISFNPRGFPCGLIIFCLSSYGGNVEARNLSFTL